MRRNWKCLISAALLGTLLAFSACGTDDPPAVTAPAGEQPTADVPADTTPDAPGAGDATGAAAGDLRDLGGQHFVVGNWWANWNVDEADPDTAEDEARLFDRIEAFDDHNFTMEVRRMGGWAEVRDMIPLEIMAGSREVHIWHMEAAWFGTMQNQNLFAPLREEFFNMPGGITNWHHGTIDVSRRNGIPYGWATGVINGGGVYFNMRLLEEAGIDPELPFDLQASGDWTWDAFMDIARAATRDLDGDGIPDTWGIATFGQDFLVRALVSNNAHYVGIDEGRFTNTTNTPEFLEALTWANNLGEEGVTMPEPEGMGWDFFISAFNNGMAAMRAAGDYVAGAQVNPNLDDPWGFVSFPMGPRAQAHRFSGNHNFQAIPVSFDEQDVSDIMYAFNLWYRPLPDFDDPLGWTAGAFASHYHPRSVNETLVMFSRNSDLMTPDFHTLVPGGMPHGPNFGWRIWHGNDPAVILEEAQPIWEEYLARANNE